MKKSVSWLLAAVALVVAVVLTIKAIDSDKKAKAAAVAAERRAEVQDSIHKALTDSTNRVMEARNDSIQRLETAASSSRRRLQALSKSIDSLVALGPGQVIELPPNATALDSAKAETRFWHDRYLQRTEAQGIATERGDSLEAANVLLHRQVFSLERLLVSADSAKDAWKVSSEAWKKVSDCRIPVIRLGCPSRTVVGVASAVGGVLLSR